MCSTHCSQGYWLHFHKNQVLFISQRHKRSQPSSLQAASRCCKFWCFTCNRKQMMMILAGWFFFQRNFYISTCFCTFSGYKLPLQSLVFALINSITGHLLFSGTLGILQIDRLYFFRMFLVHRPGSQAQSSQAGRHFVCRCISADIFFCSVIF